MKDEGGLLWNDPEIGIKWPVTKHRDIYTVDGIPLKLSEKDQKWPGIGEIKMLQGITGRSER